MNTSVCSVLDNPGAFKDKLVRFRAGVSTDYHHYTNLIDRDCEGAIGLGYTDGVPSEQKEALDAVVGWHLEDGDDRTAVATFTGRIRWEPGKALSFGPGPLQLEAHLIEQVHASPRWPR